MPTVMTGASSAQKCSFSGGAGGNSSSNSEDTKEQKKVLEKAAKEATPFCEECQKEKEENQKEEKTAEKEEEKSPKILRIYWMDEKKNFKTLGELSPGQEVTFCVEVEEGGAGEKVTVEITNENRKFKGGKNTLTFPDLIVDDDNTAYIDHFKYEFEEE
jgi:hypothetical protein